MTPYTKQIKNQGYLVKEVALIRGVTPCSMSLISKAPTQWDWLALKGLGDKPQTGDKYCDGCLHLIVGSGILITGHCSMLNEVLEHDEAGWLTRCQGGADNWTTCPDCGLTSAPSHACPYDKE